MKPLKEPRAVKADGGNFVSEWFGHRVFPAVSPGGEVLSDQKAGRCPFLTKALVRNTPCVKALASRGVCSVSSCSNGRRQDWVVCPYRGLDPDLLSRVVARLYGIPDASSSLVLPVPGLALPARRKQVLAALRNGSRRVFVYLQNRLGGEISLPASRRSPEVSFDCTLVEVLPDLSLGKYGFMEVQTMDFHGSYRAVVEALNGALNLHPDAFHKQLAENGAWLGRSIEGPNLANVFKRTFYQIMLKFRLAQHPGCAGCALVLPQSVWDSWGKHLCGPNLVRNGDVVSFQQPPGQAPTTAGTWIVVFDLGHVAGTSPDGISVTQTVAADPDALAYHALTLAPEAAIREANAHQWILDHVRQKVHESWAEVGGCP